MPYAPIFISVPPCRWFAGGATKCRRLGLALLAALARGLRHTLALALGGVALALAAAAGLFLVPFLFVATFAWVAWPSAPAQK
jgi:hypothetical protein